MRVLAPAAWSGLILLQPLWYLYWAPSGVLAPAWAATVMSLPLLPVFAGLCRGHPRAYVWGVFLGLFYFMHGVVVVMTNPAARVPGAIETALTLGFFTLAVLHLRRLREYPRPRA